MPQRFRKRNVLKWVFPLLSFVLMGVVVVWPSAVKESVQTDKLINSIFGMTYRLRQPNGELYTLKAPTACEHNAGHIKFDSPVLETKDMNMKAAGATLDVKTSHVVCEGPVVIQHERMHIHTHKADFYLGATKHADAAQAEG